MTLCSQSVHGCCELEELPKCANLGFFGGLGADGCVKLKTICVQSFEFQMLMAALNQKSFPVWKNWYIKWIPGRQMREVEEHKWVIPLYTDSDAQSVKWCYELKRWKVLNIVLGQKILMSLMSQITVTGLGVDDQMSQITVSAQEQRKGS